MMMPAKSAEDRLKSPRCAAGSCAGPVAVGQTECVSHRLHHPEGRKRLIAELRGEVAPRPLGMPVQVAAAAEIAAETWTEPSQVSKPLPASTLRSARSLWEA